LNISFESLERDIALMLNVIWILLETKDHALIDVPALSALLHDVGLQLKETASEISGSYGADCDHRSEEDSTKVLHLFLSNY
jgi:hypothetical protein